MSVGRGKHMSFISEYLEQRVLFAATLPRPDHIVIVVEENRSYDEIVESTTAPTLHRFMDSGASFANYRAIEPASLQNYLALFSGSTQGVTDDAILYSFDEPNLGRSLIDAGFSFAGYSEDLPSVGYTGAESGAYVRRHNAWVYFSNVPTSANRPFSDFPSDFSQLPTVSFVVPNLFNDMHDGTIGQADQWLDTHIGAYADWAAQHNSLLIVTWDEGAPNTDNQIATMFVGANVRAGQYDQPVNHYNLLRTIEEIYGLPAVAESATAAAITDIWNLPASPPPPPPASDFGGIIRGRVFRDSNGDGKRNPRDLPFIGATVFLDSNDNGMRDDDERSTSTLADGTFAFADLDRGTYPVMVEVPADWRATAAIKREMTLSHHRTAKAGAFGLSQNSQLKGSIFLDSDHDSLQQEQEPGLRRWSVYLDLNDDGIRENGEPRARTGKKGEWTFKSITPGTYRVCVQVRKHFTPTVPEDASTLVALAAGQVMAGVRFGVLRE